MAIPHASISQRVAPSEATASTSTGIPWRLATSASSPTYRVDEARRRLHVHDTDQIHLTAFERTFEIGGIGRLSLTESQTFGFASASQDRLLDTIGVETAIDDQGGLPFVEQRADRHFVGERSATRQHGDVTLGPEDRSKPVDDAFVQLGERTTIVNPLRSAHDAQDLSIDLDGAGTENPNVGHRYASDRLRNQKK